MEPEKGSAAAMMQKKTRASWASLAWRSGLAAAVYSAW
jgi:hypothetical protein